MKTESFFVECNKLISFVGVLSLMVLGGCDGSSSAENEPIAKSSLLDQVSVKLSVEDANNIKPLQFITNQEDLDMLTDKLKVTFSHEVDFNRDIVIVVKRYNNMPYHPSASLVNMLYLGNDGSKTIEIISHSQEVVDGVEKNINALVCAGLIINVAEKPIFLTKKTVLIDSETANLRKVVNSLEPPIDQVAENMAYVVSNSHRHRLMPSEIKSSSDLDIYAKTNDFNISQLRFHNEPFNAGHIMSSGYYISETNESFFNRPVLDNIKPITSYTSYIPTEENKVMSYHYKFQINGSRSDCNISYPNKKEALFYKFSPLSFPEKIYYTAEQNIFEKSCSNLRIANLEKLGEWISKRTWLPEE